MNSIQKPWQTLKNLDSEVYTLIEAELRRQRRGIELIASENFASLAVITAMGNILNNKYAEGLPNKRYYGGCQEVDKLENLCIQRACKVFGAKFANVQPHSGAQANAAVFLGLLKPGDRVLGLDLSHGGHLTHGSKVNFSGILYESFSYGLDAKTDLIDYNQVSALAEAHKPRMIIAGASAYARTIDFQKFRTIADHVGAYLFVDMAHIAGLVAAGLHPNPFPHAHVVTTTTHKTLRGPRGGLILWNDEKLSPLLNKGVFPGTQGGPLEHIIAAKAVCLHEAMSNDFKVYQQQVIKNAQALAHGLTHCGFKLVSGGTDNHLVLLNLSETDVSGKDLEEALGQVSITVNKNTVPNEKRSPFVTSGIRLGSPAVTSRGMGEPQMLAIAHWIYDTYRYINQQDLLEKLRATVEDFARDFPLYTEWVD